MEIKSGSATPFMMQVVDSTDHFTPETGLILTLEASKAGGEFAVFTPTSVTERGNGFYAIVPTAENTDTVGDLVVRVTNAGTEGFRALTVVENLESDTYIRIGAPVGASISVDVAAVATETGSHPTLSEIEASTVLAKEATSSTIAGYLDTEIAAIKAKTDLIPATPASTGDAMTLTVDYDSAKTAATQASLNALLTTAIAESYAADGAAPTPAQALCMILQLLAEKSIAGTAMTVKKLDGSTTAMTFTLNSATAPTAITRTA